MGNVKSKEIMYDHNINGDVQAVSGYVSKYVCKPSLFESPWVTYGCVPKCFRLMSKGIGLHYIKGLVGSYVQSFIRYNCNLFKGVDKKGKPIFSASAKSAIYNLRMTESNYDFCRVVNECFVYMRKNKAGKQFFFKLPRYYQNFLFPLRKFKQEYYDKRNQCIRTRLVSRLDTESAIYRLYKDYVLALAVERSRADAVEISQSKGISLDDAYIEVESNHRQLLRERYSRCLQSFEKYYQSHFAKPE